MKGLLMKDWLVLRRYFSMMLVFVLAYGAAGMFSKKMGFAGMATMMGVMLSMTAFSYDAQAGWDRMGASLPVSRRQMVAARYLITLFITAIGELLAIVMLVVYRQVRGGSWELVWGNALGALVAALLVCMGLLPIIYRYGIEKARIIVVGMVILPITLIVLAGEFLPKEILRPMLVAVIVLALVLPAPSYLLSCRIFEAKEL